MLKKYDKNTKFIIIGRQYNDIDCRTPLIFELQKQNIINIEIMTIPTVSSTGLNINHEVADLENINFNNFFEKFLNNKVLSLIRWLSRNVELNTVGLIRYRLWPFIWKLLSSTLILNDEVEFKFHDYCDNAIIIIDDIYLDPERSKIVEWLRKKSDLSIFCIAHGQNTYFNLWHDKIGGIQLRKTNNNNIVVFSPSENHSRVLNKAHPGIKTFTIGNTRFDKQWIINDPLKKLVTDYTTGHDARIKVLFTLSKIDYGQDAETLSEIINCILDSDEIILCLKPHTRGMSVSELNINQNANLRIETLVSTRQLIEWSDIVLYTGSSIIFEAMIKNKKTLYLKSQQKYKTIFDMLPINLKHYTGDNIIDKIKKLEMPENVEFDMNNFLIEHTYGKNSDGKVCEKFLSNHVWTNRN